MQTNDIKELAKKENFKKTIRHNLVIGMLIMSLVVLFMTSTDRYWKNFDFLSPFLTNAFTGNSIGFSISSGLFISTIFTYMLVIAPTKRKANNAKIALLHPPSMVLEGVKGGLHTWSKNIVFCNRDECSNKNIIQYKKTLQNKNYNEAQINISLQHISETLHLFEYSLSVAMSISTTHGLCWMGMTDSIKKLTDVHSDYDFSQEETRKSAIELFYLYMDEFIQNLEQFVLLKI